jgi:hypothetical protein
VAQVQVGNLTLSLGERPKGVEFVIRDRGSNLPRSFDAVLNANGTRILRTAAWVPKLCHVL